MKRNDLKEKLYEIIFEADTKIGKRFDLFLIGLIVISIVVVMLESVKSFQTQMGGLLTLIEWVITIIFTLEYILRLWIVHKPLKFALSFYYLISNIRVFFGRSFNNLTQELILLL